jgi:leader peptidase (prepilin peptidase) / N-methyltransferase
MGFPLAEVAYVVFAFVLGSCAGSFLNVVIGRLPLEKSLLWPNSRCLTCLHPLNLADNLPIIGYLRRRGRCRYCGTPFSSRYMWVELATGVAFALIFYMDVLANWHRLPAMDDARNQIRVNGLPPWQALVFFAHHAVLFSFLMAAALCDWDRREIPLSLTVTGTVIGLMAATCFPWPFPNDPAVAAQFQNPVVAGGIVQQKNWAFGPLPGEIPRGMYPWPLWGPVPVWLWEHRWALGLVTGLIGAVVGMTLLRFVKFMFERGLGKEALGMGDADLMMMAGAFIGWQPVVAAFFVGTFIALPLGLILRFGKGERAIPFGPGLAIGVIVTLYWWPWLGRGLKTLFFDHITVLLAVALLAVGLFIGSIFLRAFGFGPPAEAK